MKPVLRNALRAAAEEMIVSLVKTAPNPLIYELRDFGVGLSNGGEPLAEGSGPPVFLGCLPRTGASYCPVGPCVN